MELLSKNCVFCGPSLTRTSFGWWRVWDSCDHIRVWHLVCRRFDLDFPVLESLDICVYLSRVGVDTILSECGFIVLCRFLIACVVSIDPLPHCRNLLICYSIRNERSSLIQAGERLTIFLGRIEPVLVRLLLFIHLLGLLVIFNTQRDGKTD